MTEQCESLLPDEAQCPREARWVVGVGMRRTDRQLACARHLARVCQAMTEAEKPRRPLLTVYSADEKEPAGGW